jgi:predicted RND superfamily exporter protein
MKHLILPLLIFLARPMLAQTHLDGYLQLALTNYPQISSLALVLIGGLISSTILSRIVTPVMYKLIPPTIEPSHVPQKRELAAV